MKKAFYMLAVTCTLITSGSNAYALDGEIQYVQSLAAFLLTLTQNAGTIWPGFHVSNNPLILLAEEGRNQQDDSLYVFNFSSQNADWQKQTINDLPVYYSPHDTLGAHQFKFSLHNPYLMLENKPAMIFPYTSGMSPEINNAAFAAMSYGYYEFFISPYAKTKQALMQQANIVHDSFNNPELYSLLLLEARALKEYINTRNEEALKTYTAIFQYRYRLLDKNAQMFEVTAGEPFCYYYVGLKAAYQKDADFIKHALASYPSMPSSATYIKYEYQGVLNFIYIAVPFALDTVLPDWKSTVEAINTPPSMLLQQHYHFTNKEIEARVKTAKASYEYSATLAHVQNLLKSYLQKMKTLQMQYAQGAGVEVMVSFPKDALMHTQSASDDYTVNSQLEIYPSGASINIEDQEFSFHGKNMPVFYRNFENNTENENTLIKLKLPPTTVIVVDGKTETLQHFVANAKNTVFHKLTMSSTGQIPFSITLDINGPAYIMYIDKGKLMIKYPTVMHMEPKLLSRVVLQPIA